MKWQRNMSQMNKQAKILEQLNEVEIGNLSGEKKNQNIDSEDIQDIGKRIDTQIEKITLVEESLFSLLYIFVSFVKDKASVYARIYPWNFYFVPLIYISVFVPVSYCLDDCSFIVQSEVRKVDSFSSIFLSQDCFGYLRLFVLPYKLLVTCSSSVKNTIGSLIRIVLNVQFLLWIMCQFSLY